MGDSDFFLAENEVSGEARRRARRDALHDLLIRGALGDRRQGRARALAHWSWRVQVRAVLPVLARAFLAVAVGTGDCAHVDRDVVDVAARFARCSIHARARALPHREERACDRGLVGRFLRHDLLERWLSRASLALGIPIERNALADHRAARTYLSRVGLGELVTSREAQVCRLGIVLIKIELEELWLGVSIGVALDHDLESVGPLEGVEIAIVWPHVEVSDVVCDLGHNLADLDFATRASKRGDVKLLEALHSTTMWLILMWLNWKPASSLMCPWTVRSERFLLE